MRITKSVEDLQTFRPELLEPVRWLVYGERSSRPVVVELRERFGLDARGAIAAIRLADEMRREARR